LLRQGFLASALTGRSNPNVFDNEGWWIHRTLVEQWMQERGKSKTKAR
jgi:hypothetical protein